jgi:hypothetical protein
MDRAAGGAIGRLRRQDHNTQTLGEGGGYDPSRCANALVTLGGWPPTLIEGSYCAAQTAADSRSEIDHLHRNTIL